MERHQTLFLILLLILPAGYAAENDTIVSPGPPQTTSIEKLVSSMDAMKQQIADQQKNINELRVQLDEKLSTQYWGLLGFIAAYTVCILALRGILSEIWTWAMYTRKKRKVEKFQERLASELKNLSTETRNTSTLLQMIKIDLASIKSDVALVEKQKKPKAEPRSLWDRLTGRKKDAE